MLSRFSSLDYLHFLQYAIISNRFCAELVIQLNQRVLKRARLTGIAFQTKLLVIGN